MYDKLHIMERVYRTLLWLGYPEAGVEWMRRHRLPVIVVLAILAWMPILALVWLIMWLVGP